MRGAGAFAAVVAVLAPALVAGAESLGARYPDLRAALQARIDAVPAEGATGAQRKEKALLAKSLKVLDADAATLDADLSAACRAMQPLARLRLWEDPVLGPLCYALRDDLDLRVRDRTDSLRKSEVYLFDQGVRARTERIRTAAMDLVLAAEDPADGGTMFPALLKALKTVEKGEKSAARVLKPARSNRLDVLLLHNKAPFSIETRIRPGDSQVQLFSIAYDAGTDVATLSLVIAKGGVSRSLTLPVSGPGVGTHVLDPAAPSLLADPPTCDYVFDTEPIYGVTFSAWNPAEHLAAGTFNVLFVDEPRYLSCYDGIVGIFTWTDVTVGP